MVRVGELLGNAVVVDPSRPNTNGGATPQPEGTRARPLFRTFKVCRRCDEEFRGLSFAPQYDDDPAQAGYCEPCLDAMEQRGAATSHRAVLRLVASPEAQPAEDVL